MTKEGFNRKLTTILSADAKSFIRLMDDDEEATVRICLSGIAYDQVANKLGLEYENLGEHQVKNIGTPIRVYRVLSFPGAPVHRVVKARENLGRRWRKTVLSSAVVVVVVVVLGVWQLYNRRPSVEPTSVEKMAFLLPGKSSIDVLPFINMSGDTKEEYLSDGITEEIVIALSSKKYIKVSMKIKNKLVAVKLRTTICLLIAFCCLSVFSKQRVKSKKSFAVELEFNQPLFYDNPDVSSPKVAICEEQASELDRKLCYARRYLVEHQSVDGAWRGPLKMDSSINSWYIIFARLMDSVNPERERKAINYILKEMNDEGGWSLLSTQENAGSDINPTLANYLSLKVANYPGDLSKTEKLLQKLDEVSGLEIFNLILLYVTDQFSAKNMPYVSMRIISLPKLYSRMGHMRSFVLPLTYLIYLKENTTYSTPSRFPNLIGHLIPKNLGRYQTLIHSQKPTVSDIMRNIPRLFFKSDRSAVVDEILSGLRQRLLKPNYAFAFFHKLDQWLTPTCDEKKMLHWLLEHQDENGTFGGITQQTLLSIYCLYIKDKALYKQEITAGFRGIESYQFASDDTLFQSFTDITNFMTAYAVLSLTPNRFAEEKDAVSNAISHLFKHQITTYGDWSYVVNNVEPAGWAHQPFNQHTPDIDDSAVIMHGLCQVGPERLTAAQLAYIEKSILWILAMQNSDGGWAAYDKDNYEIFSQVLEYEGIFSSVEDITSRAIISLGCWGYQLTHKQRNAQRLSLLFPNVDFQDVANAISAAVDYLKAARDDRGYWRGHWYTNYTYGTGQVLQALHAVGENPRQLYIRESIDWLLRVQNRDGGWGESIRSYNGLRIFVPDKSTIGQTSWVLKGLLPYTGVYPQLNYFLARSSRYLLSEFDEFKKTWKQSDRKATVLPYRLYGNYRFWETTLTIKALETYRSQRMARQASR